MTRKIYKRIGLRRDKNFGDLSDARISLNNLLDGLVDTEGNTFISDDLNAIRNINNIGLSNQQYLKVVGSTTKYTSSDGNNNNFIPHITYQNRIDQFTVFSGEPRISGGNGPTARYWQKDQILVNQENSSDDTEKKFEYWQNTNSTTSEVLAGVTTMGQLPNDTQWERGNFDYTGKLHPQSVLTDGGVTWEGYFVATETGPHIFNFYTTGYTTIDFNLEGYEEDSDKVQTPTSIAAVGAGNTYKEWVRVGVTTTFDGNSANANSNTLSIKADFSKTIGIGMSVSGSGLISGTGGSGETIWPTVEDYNNSINGSTSTVTLKPIPGQQYSVNGAINNGTLTFFRNFGQEIHTEFTTQYLIQFQKYRFRFRFFFPKDINTIKLERMFDVDFNMPSESSRDLYYYSLFDLDYTFTEAKKGEFNIFYDNSVRFGGTNPIGIGGTLAESIANPFTDTNPYIKVSTSDKIQAKYSPKTSLASILKRTQSCTGTAGGTVLACNNTGGVEVGNYVFGPNTDDSTNLVAEGTRVIDVIINDLIIVDKPCLIDGSQNLNFIDHRGFVKRIKGSATQSGGTLVALSSGYSTGDNDKWKAKIKKGMILLTTPQSGTDVDSYTRVTSVNSDTQMNISSGMTNSATTLIYIYQSRSLIDNSLESFCPQTGGTRTRCHLLPVNFDSDGDGVDEAYIAAAGQNVIQLVDVSGLTTGLIVQGFGIPDGTVIDSVSGNSISLKDASNNSVNLTKSINGGATVTIHGLSGDRQLCCPPTDTSPPFEASPNGLMTTDDKQNLSFTQGNVKFDELRFKFPSNQTGIVTSYGFGGASETVNRKIHLKAGATQDQANGLFYILGQTV